jgi:hypothetical protein
MSRFQELVKSALLDFIYNGKRMGRYLIRALAGRSLMRFRSTRSDWEYVTQQSVGLNASDDPVQVRVQCRFILSSLKSLKGIFVHFTEDSAGTEASACMRSLMLSLLSVNRCSDHAMDCFCIL